MAKFQGKPLTGSLVLSGNFHLSRRFTRQVDEIGPRCAFRFYPGRADPWPSGRPRAVINNKGQILRIHVTCEKMEDLIRSSVIYRNFMLNLRALFYIAKLRIIKKSFLVKTSNSGYEVIKDKTSCAYHKIFFLISFLSFLLELIESAARILQRFA